MDASVETSNFISSSSSENVSEVIKMAKESKNINKCSRETGIDRRLISRWLKKEDSIKNTRNKRSRLYANTGQDKSFYSSMEKTLYDWILT
ncbi:unnamed protein product [Brachionus calyciflorus]|uniref:HTH psq-type domain-containing protein n=1 Tax=Brachionus calyciflorus TaxID=104777 RepID=A0A814MBL0_9BILA|nr:unnamed protein product [Brachionus calyciflorus]